MGKVHIALGAAVVIAGIVLYVIVSGGDDDTDDTTQATTKATAVAQKSGSSETLPAGDPTVVTTTGVAARDGEPPPIETVNEDGTRVRDYRGREIQRDPNAELRRPIETLNIEPQLMSKLGLELRGVAKRCKAEHAADVARGSRVQPRVTFSVSEDRLTVDETELSLINIPTGSGFESCMRSGVIGLSVAAPKHAFIASHKMAVPINLDRL